MRDARYWIDHLKLERHPEGGYFRELYRSTETLDPAALPKRFLAARSIATSIVYLLEQGDFSAFHRIRSDETWHFYGGSPLELYQLSESSPGECQRILIGPELHLGQYVQWTVPAGVWFAARVSEGGGFSVLGCTVSPGFDFEDFELAKVDELARVFPQHTGLIGQLSLKWGK